MKEYGSSVQKLVNYIMTIADREQRTKYAFIMVDLMKQIHPNMKDNSQDYSKKLWDDLYIMSNFALDVQGPYPPPSPESVGKAPRKVAYNQHHLKFKHYGRNVELLILRAIAEEKLEDKKILVAYIARLTFNVRCAGAVFVIKLIEPPIASASISGVNAFATSTLWIISDGTASKIDARVPYTDADGRRLPLNRVDVHEKGVPRTVA